MMTRLFFASLIAGAALLPPAMVAGCASSDTKPPSGPGGPTGEQRDTEMKHEDCDLKSSDAKGLDANGDGRPDIIKVFSGGKEVCRAVDINMDTMIDVFVYFDNAGNVRRRESGFDRDTQPDEISFYQNGQLVRKERETNNDRRIDTWSYFQAKRLIREERDSTGDGYVDQWWTFDRPDKPKCAMVVTDEDGDGRPDEASKMDTCNPDGKPEVPPPPAPTATASDDPPPGDDPPPSDPPPGDDPPPAVDPTAAAPPAPAAPPSSTADPAAGGAAPTP